MEGKTLSKSALRNISPPISTHRKETPTRRPRVFINVPLDFDLAEDAVLVKISNSARLIQTKAVIYTLNNIFYKTTSAFSAEVFSFL